ncbi:FAD-dependent oxidoreductase [Gordonia sp. HY002]|uniref:FAD-dependent oxidoreductase n=1 Tax=Gordonia zhenghanii TaxID=2911516 RepID=UPI001EF04C86|nr:FAD-dependent oxidoreductase [Gordonia zhenghanii]MCF8571865.1 FAD-dependent oxidoreductase [Gordonia zhenghanii]MCF8604422.1 FAD-dependent oxidoreductase [Gordonia zhenghanii]
MGRELSVVGGGVIGLACALAATDAGWTTTVHDAGPRARATHVAGGMLGCLGEGQPGEDRLLDLSSQSAALWPDFLGRLGDPAVHTASDSILMAASGTDFAYLDDQVAFVRDRLPAASLRRSTGSELRRAEPSLGRGLAGGYLAEGEGAVDNRLLIDALAAALRASGGQVVDATVDDPTELPGDRVLIAAGLGSAALAGAGVPVHGEKGEILRLRRTRWSVPPPRHVIRGRRHGRPVYLVPRADGVVVGATQYEAQGPDDRRPQAVGVADLLADAIAVMPGLSSYELVEAAAGIRPCSADGLPIVQRIDDRMLVATGHGRNGIALAPWTASRVMELLA